MKMPNQNQSKENEIYNLLVHKSLLNKSIKRLVSDSWNKIIVNPDFKKSINKLNEKLNLSQRINIALNVYKVIRKYKLTFTIQIIYDLFNINSNDIKNYKNKIDFGTYKYETYLIYKILNDENCINADNIINKWIKSQKKEFLLGVNHNELIENPIKENNLENKIFNKVNKIKTKSINYINIINENFPNVIKINRNLLEEIKINNSWIDMPINNKRFCLSENKYRFKTIIKNKMKINIIKNIRKIINNIKYKKYENLLNLKWENPDLNNLILISNITKFDISTVIKWFRNNIFNDLYDKYYYVKYELGYFSKKSSEINKIKFNSNSLNNKYNAYFNENDILNVYYILQNKIKRY